MIGEVLEINGLAIDRERTENRQGDVWFFRPDGWFSAVIVSRNQKWRACPPDTVAQLNCWPPGQIGWVSVWLDREGKTILPNGQRGNDWAPLLDLAIEAGLELPEPA